MKSIKSTRVTSANTVVVWPPILSFNYLTKRLLVVKAPLISLRFYNHHHFIGPDSDNDVQWWEFLLFKVGQIVWLRSACEAPKHLCSQNLWLSQKDGLNGSGNRGNTHVTSPDETDIFLLRTNQQNYLRKPKLFTGETIQGYTQNQRWKMF